MRHFFNIIRFLFIPISLIKNISWIAALAFGAKESSVANNFFTLTNLSVVLFVIIAGSLKGNLFLNSYLTV